MYSFVHHDEPLTLRPEGTAGAARAYVEHAVHSAGAGHALVLRRADVPRRAARSAGATGSSTRSARRSSATPGPACDAEMIDMLVGFLGELGIPDVEVLVNSLGGAEDARALPRRARRRTSTPKSDALSPETRSAASRRTRSASSTRRTRATARPCAGAPTILDFLDDDDRDALRRRSARTSTRSGTPYTVDAEARARARLLHAHALRDQRRDTRSSARQTRSLGGGRYDGMVADLGGPEVPGDRLRGGARAPAHRERAAEVPAERRRRARRAARRGGDRRGARPRARPPRERRPRARSTRAAASLKSQLRRANALGRAGRAHPRRRRAREGVVQVKDLDGARAGDDAARRAPSASVAGDAPRRGPPSRRPREPRVSARARGCVLLATMAARLAGRSAAQRPAAKDAAPRPHGAEAPTEDDEDHTACVRARSREIAPPADPLAMLPEVAASASAATTTAARRRPRAPARPRAGLPYYERARRLPPAPLAAASTSSRRAASAIPRTQRYGVPSRRITEGLYGLLYYQRRSPKLDMDVLFPAFWRVRDGRRPRRRRRARSSTARRRASTTTGSRRSSSQGARKDGGYFHSPLAPHDVALEREGRVHARRAVLPRPHGHRRRLGRRAVLLPRRQRQHRRQRAARTRSSRRSSSTTREHELDTSTFTVVGPVIAQSNPKRDVFDVAPFFFHIAGQARDGRRRASRTRRSSRSFTTARPATSRSSSCPATSARDAHDATRSCHAVLLARDDAQRRRRRSTAIGPILPLCWNYRDKDVGVHAWALAPFFYTSNSAGRATTGSRRSSGASRRTACRARTGSFPTITRDVDQHGWETTSTRSSTSAAATTRRTRSSRRSSGTSRTRRAGPRSASRSTGASPTRRTTRSRRSPRNTLYMQKRVAGGHRLAVSPPAALLVRREPERLLLERPLRPRRLRKDRAGEIPESLLAPHQSRRSGPHRNRLALTKKRNRKGGRSGREEKDFLSKKLSSLAFLIFPPSCSLLSGAEQSWRIFH